MQKKFKFFVKNGFEFLGDKAPWLVRLLLFFLYPIPHLYVLMAHIAKLPQPVQRRQWHIKNGPLRGIKLEGLLSAEIIPVLTNTMEIKNCDLLRMLSLQPGIALDVGGSYGYYALFLSRLIERVYSFEPDWHSFGRLTYNLALNEIKNVTPLPLCVSDSSTGLAKWQSFDNEPWNSCLVHDLSACNSDRLTIVPVITLDEFVNTLDSTEKIRLIKIDVEGAELMVLQGAVKLIREVQPLIFCELHGTDIARRVFEFLEEFEYVWEMVEYVSETRQHIFAFPSNQALIYRPLFAQ